MQSKIDKALKVIREGGVILYPTDTIWGLGCDATNKYAIKKIYDIKKRNESKALITLVADINMLQGITNFVPNIDLISVPTTVIYSETYGLAKNLLAEDDSAAIRVVKDAFCNNLIDQLGKPIVSTSANISKESTPKEFSDISDSIIKNVDYVVNLRQSERMENPSKIIKIGRDGKITELR